jgi:hypothetical protein
VNLAQHLIEHAALGVAPVALPVNEGAAVNLAQHLIEHAALGVAFVALPVNDIGRAGAPGFGVGIAPADRINGRVGMTGYTDPMSDNFGNYLLPDGSVQVWIPAFYYKEGTGANGLAVNQIHIERFGAFADVEAANAAGYALHRAFYNAGAVQPGFWRDKYVCSNNGGVASSIKLGNPLSSNSAHNPFSALNGSPANIYGGALAAARTRGAQFFPATIFMADALNRLARAAGQAGGPLCAWHDPAGVNNFPKGCNNNALGDTNDATLRFVSDGYSNCSKAGSGNQFAKTTHNGQACGVTDINGPMWQIAPGITSNGSTYFILKTAVDMEQVTAGNTMGTDLWGANGITALYDTLGATFGALTASSTAKKIGAATQTFSESVSGLEWAAACAGIPLATGVGGTNLFGQDGLWDYRPNELGPVAFGAWDHASGAGPGARSFYDTRGYSYGLVGLASASYR